METLSWGIIAPQVKAQAFADDLAYARYPHQIKSCLFPDEEQGTLEGVRSCRTMKELLQGDIDAVYIATPYTRHYDEVKHCLLHRKAVLCERPIAFSTEEFELLMQLSEKQQTFMMEAMWIRFMPSIKKVLSLLGEGQLGEVVSVKASVHARNGTGTRSPALIELGAYPVFLCTLLLGLPAYVEANGRMREQGSEDFFSAFLSYDNGLYGFIEASTAAHGTSSAVITCEGGTIHIRNPWSPKPEGIAVQYFSGTSKVHKSTWEGQGLHFEIDEVYECLQEGRIESQLYCHHFMLDVLHSVEAIRQQLG
ncbi:MAG TPA: Gfo/Idh/MocA family oxidoreductase [Chitinophagaceae bacterium]|jgi:predicted dehydrogenase|nr:Gfo/Idh/MocA family oxidoreductase [Chitinophagaceae bacterium]